MSCYLLWSLEVDFMCFLWSLEVGLHLFCFFSGKQMRNKLLSLLDTVDFTHQFPPELQLTFFDPKMIEAVLSNHEVQDAEGVAYYDVRSLRRLLIAELDNQQGPMMSGQRPLIMEVILELCSMQSPLPLFSPLLQHEIQIKEKQIKAKS